MDDQVCPEAAFSTGSGRESTDVQDSGILLMVVVQTTW